MKNLIDKSMCYLATILISALSETVDADDFSEKFKRHITQSNVAVKTVHYQGESAKDGLNPVKQNHISNRD
jgi:hypothetical protein